MNKFKKVLVVFISIIFLILAIKFLFPNLNLPIFVKQEQELEVLNQGNDLNNIDSIHIGQADFIRLIAVQDNTPALDLLMNHHLIDFQEYDFGIFIEEIDGLRGDQDNFWAIYIDDEMSMIGIQDIVLNRGEAIEFRYEAIEK